MKVIFADEGFNVLQDENGAVVLETMVAPGGVGVRKHLPVAKAMEMTAAINTASFPFSQTARVAG